MKINFLFWLLIINCLTNNLYTMEESYLPETKIVVEGKDIWIIPVEDKQDNVQKNSKLNSDILNKPINSRSNTSFMEIVAYTKSSEVIKLLIEHGADINQMHPLNGKTPLHFACENNSTPSIVEELVFNGANLNAVCSGKHTPLYCAAICSATPGAITEVFLVAAKCNTSFDINAISLEPEGNSSLMNIAAHVKYAEIIKILVKHGANVNQTHTTSLWTPLHFACSYNNRPEVIAELIMHGADVNALDIYGYTPLMTAAIRSENAGEIIKAFFQAIYALEKRSNNN